MKATMLALFGRYTYVGELGRGARGRVFCVRDEAEGGALRAIKAVEGDAADALVWEFAQLTRVSHPRVARVRELLRLREAAPAPYRLAEASLLLVEDLAPGKPLSEWPVPADRGAREALAARAALSLAEGLAAIHAAGLVHGDLKPGNVVVEGGASTLVDLGFAAPPGFGERPRGTPRFMAPELLAGLSSPRSDTYAFGATLFDWLSGEPAAPSTALGAQGLVARRAEALEGIAAAPLKELIASCLSPDPDARPSDGHALHAALVPLARAASVLSWKDPALYLPKATPAALAGRARSLPFCGREAELARLLEKLERREVVLVAGARGAGRTRLVAEALRKLTLTRAERGQDPPSVVRSLEAVRALQGAPSVLWIEPAAEEREAALNAALRVHALRGASLAVVVECDPLFSPPGVERIALGPLPAEAFSALFTQLLGAKAQAPELVAHVRAASQALPGRLCELVAEAYAAGRDVRDPRSYVAADGGGEARLLSAESRALAGRMAWAGGRLTRAQCAAVFDDPEQLSLAFNELWARRLLVAGGRGLELLPALARELRADLLADRAHWVQGIAKEGAPESGFFWFALGDEARARQAFAREAEGLRKEGDLLALLGLLREACALLPDEGLAYLRADAERARADYAAALAALHAAQRPESRLLRAEVLRLSGDRERAAREAAALSEGPEHGGAEIRQRARALGARIAFDAGRVEEARELALSLGSCEDPEALYRAREVVLLTELTRTLPELDRAAELVRLAAALPSPRMNARAHALRAQLAARHGLMTEALADIGVALTLTRRAGEVHEAAVYALNQGLLQFERGDLGAALSALEEATFELARIDRASDLARATYNLAALVLLVGDDVRAEALLASGLRFAEEARDPSVLGYLEMGCAEIALRRGQHAKALARLEVALERLPATLGPVRAVLLARAAEAAATIDQRARAETLLHAAYEAASPEDTTAQLELCVADIAVHRAAGNEAGAEQVAQRGMRYVNEGAPFAERLRFLLGSLDAGRGREVSASGRERALLCRALLEAALASLPVDLRRSMRARPEVSRVLGSDSARGPVARSEDRGRFRALLRATRRLFGTPRPASVAQRVVEIALELLHAERALLIVFGATGELEVRAKLELSPTSAAPVFSRSVVERVWSEGKPLLTLEASQDLRLRGAESVHALSVRSVLAVPIQGFGAPSVLYLDDRLRADAFGDDDLALLEDLAYLAGEALRVAHARRADVKRAQRAEQEASALTRALSERQSGEEDGAPLIGTSTALSAVVATARRVARSEVAVLITGESGTGKELLARLLHRESPRHARAFVAESCASLPETLLESALFGHVRGAFTGADRARRGLFEIADQGTLFLDEVGEMSPALQAKLLRVLQEGEYRPLGSERTRRCDVRLVAATRRDLRERVREGGFREDLYYRLAVVTLELPPLSARREDIPLLVRHFLTKYKSEGESASITPAALRALTEREYPGNVRQLENEVRRALALAEQGRIDVGDLSPLPSAAEAAPALSLHAQLEALSVRLVSEAMAQASGNITQAAELLGISRFGLQKMLKRWEHQHPRK